MVRMIKELDFLRDNWMQGVILFCFTILLVILFAKGVFEPKAQEIYERGYKQGRSECGKVEWNKGQYGYVFPEYISNNSFFFEENSS
jgi:hypothetical protein